MRKIGLGNPASVSRFQRYLEQHSRPYGPGWHVPAFQAANTQRPGRRAEHPDRHEKTQARTPISAT